MKQTASWILALLILRPWRWRQHVPPKYRLNFKGLHRIKSQTIELFITTAVRTSDPIYDLHIHKSGDSTYFSVSLVCTYYTTQSHYPEKPHHVSSSLWKPHVLFINFHSSMALQPFVGPWPLLQFRNLYTAGRTPWTGDQSVARPLPTHRTTQAQDKRTHKYKCLWVGFEPTIPGFERAKTVHALDRAATVIGPHILYCIYITSTFLRFLYRIYQNPNILPVQ
jgi:hypothetical protein